MAADNSNFRENYTEDRIRNISLEFTRLNGLTYLDHTGSTLYADNQIKAVFEDFKSNIYGNPHSLSLCSKNCQDSVELIRYRILNHFHTNAEEYSVIFTSGATSAIKLVVETFNWNGTITKDELKDSKSNSKLTKELSSQTDLSVDNKNGKLVYLSENHTSVIGMREVVMNKGCEAESISVHELKKCFSLCNDTSTNVSRNSLFVYPAQCNFSGVKHPLSWIEDTHRGALNALTPGKPSKWFCLLDAATYVSTNDLNLSQFKPDFVCISFYKIFGYPTGLGALLVKNSSGYILKKEYFGGGSVLVSLSNRRFHEPKSGFERFEDGTISFLSILSIRHGFDILEKLVGNMLNVSQHTFNLAQYFYQSLRRMHHGNGRPLAKLYSDTNYDDIKTQGNIVNFNLLRASGKYIGYAEVLHMANLNNIHIRTGCFCNSGACQRHLGLTDQELLDNFEAGHVCGDTMDLINGKPTGSVRVSFGYMSTKRDADAMLQMIDNCFKEKFYSNSSGLSANKGSEMLDVLPNENYIPSHKIPFIEDIETSRVKVPTVMNSEVKSTITHIFLYPIKSCGAFQVNDWPLGHRGLLYDREWMVVSSAGVCLTQKREPRLCMICPSINLEKGVLSLTYPGMKEINVPLDLNSTEATTTLSLCESKVCGDKVQAMDCGDAVADWLTLAISDPYLGNLRLYRQSSGDSRNSFKGKDKLQSKQSISGGMKNSLSLSNKAQFLLLNKASIEWLAEKIKEREGTIFKEDDLISRFRCNFVVQGPKALCENKWKSVTIGNSVFQSEGLCTRCQIVCIDQTTGEKTKEPLSTISQIFEGNIKFGIYLSLNDSNKKQLRICVGDNAEYNERTKA